MTASVSVVLCTYNGAAYLAEQLASLVSQTRLPDEMVIRDDGSTDQTMQILEAFAASAAFPVSIKQNRVRLGAFGNFWSAIHDANGDLVALCDQDDVWLPSKLERAIKLLDGDPRSGATFSDGWCIDDSGAVTGQSLWDSARFTMTERSRFETGEELEVLLRHPVVTGSTLTFRAALLPQLDPGPEMPHDYWISIAVAMRSLVVPMREPLIKYRLHDSNTIGFPHQLSLLAHRLRYAFDPRYRHGSLSTRLSRMEDVARLLDYESWPRVTSVEKEGLGSRIESLRFALSLPDTVWHRISFVRRG